MVVKVLVGDPTNFVFRHAAHDLVLQIATSKSLHGAKGVDQAFSLRREIFGFDHSELVDGLEIFLERLF